MNNRPINEESLRLNISFPEKVIFERAKKEKPFCYGYNTTNLNSKVWLAHNGKLFVIEPGNSTKEKSKESLHEKNSKEIIEVINVYDNKSLKCVCSISPFTDKYQIYESDGIQFEQRSYMDYKYNKVIISFYGCFLETTEWNTFVFSIDIDNYKIEPINNLRSSDTAGHWTKKFLNDNEYVCTQRTWISGIRTHQTIMQNNSSSHVLNTQIKDSLDVLPISKEQILILRDNSITFFGYENKEWKEQETLKLPSSTLSFNQLLRLNKNEVLLLGSDKNSDKQSLCLINSKEKLFGKVWEAKTNVNMHFLEKNLVFNSMLVGYVTNNFGSLDFFLFNFQNRNIQKFQQKDVGLVSDFFFDSKNSTANIVTDLGILDNVYLEDPFYKSKGNVPSFHAYEFRKFQYTDKQTQMPVIQHPIVTILSEYLLRDLTNITCEYVGNDYCVEKMNRSSIINKTNILSLEELNESKDQRNRVKSQQQITLSFYNILDANLKKFGIAKEDKRIDKILDTINLLYAQNTMLPVISILLGCLEYYKKDALCEKDSHNFFKSKYTNLANCLQFTIDAFKASDHGKSIPKEFYELTDDMIEAYSVFCRNRFSRTFNI